MGGGGATAGGVAEEEKIAGESASVIKITLLC
jgi:hypothetical protein